MAQSKNVPQYGARSVLKAASTSMPTLQMSQPVLAAALVMMATICELARVEAVATDNRESESVTETTQTKPDVKAMGRNPLEYLQLFRVSGDQSEPIRWKVAR
jgi:hypothetical protein